MKINNLFEDLTRTGESKSAVVGWGRGMGHKGHMFLASSVVTHADELSADPYFVVSKTVGKDDPITPEEKLEIYKKVFPEKGHIFQTASDEMPDLTRVLSKLNSLGYDNVTVVVGADQKKALSYVQNYNGTPDKKGNIPYSFKELNVISRQETNDPNAGEEGPRATPMRDILKNPNASEEEKFKLWRSSMSPELSDQEVKDLMSKASDRMGEFTGKKDKVAESVTPDQFKKTMLSEVKRLVEEIKKDPYISKMLKEDNQDEDYYYVVRRQTEQDIELEMPSKMWTGLKPKHATYEEAKAAYEELKNKHPREKFTVTRHPRTSHIGGKPNREFPEGVAEGSDNIEQIKAKIRELEAEQEENKYGSFAYDSVDAELQFLYGKLDKIKKQGVAEGSDDIEDTRQWRDAIALAKSQKAIRQARYGKDQKFYADGTPVTPEEVARRAAERKAKKKGVAEGSGGARYKIKSIGKDKNGDYYISPNTGKKVYKNAKVGDHETPRGEVKPNVAEGKIKIKIKHPPETAQEKLYKKHQELRKKSGLPDPEEYKKKAAEKQKEIDDMKEAKTAEPPKPRNFVAKNAKTAGAGKHKDAKKAEKQGKVKHKAQSIPLDESKWGPAMKAYAKRNIP
jgi:hypothetical protein